MKKMYTVRLKHRVYTPRAVPLLNVEVEAHSKQAARKEVSKCCPNYYVLCVWESNANLPAVSKL